MTDRSTYVDVQHDDDKNEYRVVERATGKVVARFRYKPRSEMARGIAAGRANIHRMEINRKITYPTNVNDPS